MATCVEGWGRLVSGCRAGLGRVKSPRAVSSAAEGDEKCSSLVDLVNLGLGGVLASGIFVVAGVTSQNIAGPSVVISILVALLAASFSAICFAEFRCRWPQLIGSAYEYNYLSTGEGTAFLIGWLIILERVSCLALLARSISQYFDFLVGSKILKQTTDHVGKIHLFQSYPDFLSCFIAIAFTALVAVGAKRPRMALLLTNCFIVLTTIFCLVVGLFHLDFKLWKDVKHFFPFGYNGVMEGAATFFYAFTSFADMTSRSDISRRGGRGTLLLSLLTVSGILVCFYMGVSSTVTLLSPMSSLKTETPYAESFSKVGNHWLKFVLCPGAIIVLVATILMMYTDLTNIVCGLAEDGLLFQRLSVKHDRTGTSLLAIGVIGLITGVFAMLFNTTNLIQLASLSALTVFSISSISATLLRYSPIGFSKSPEHSRSPRRRRRRRRPPSKPQQSNGAVGGYGATHVNNNTETVDAETESSPSGHKPVSFSFDRFDPWDTQHNSLAFQSNESDRDDSSSDTDIDEVVEEYKEKLQVAAVNSCGIPSTFGQIPTEATYKRASWALMGIFVSNLLFSAMLTHGVDRVKQGSVVSIFFLVVSLLSLLVSIAGLVTQPRDKVTPYDLPVTMPFVPWTPIITLLINIHLMLRMPALVWVQAIIWIATGIVLYLSYGVSHSRAAFYYEHIPEEETVLLPRSPSPVLEPRILEAHRSSCGYQDVDTVLIE